MKRDYRKWRTPALELLGASFGAFHAVALAIPSVSASGGRTLSLSRIRHQVPHHRAHLKSMAVLGTVVVNVDRRDRGREVERVVGA
ncbi:MAG: hypothetical protein ACYC9W_05865 [Candidatus Limnocylindria bacterium]